MKSESCNRLSITNGTDVPVGKAGDSHASFLVIARICALMVSLGSLFFGNCYASPTPQDALIYYSKGNQNVYWTSLQFLYDHPDKDDLRIWLTELVRLDCTIKIDFLLAPDLARTAQLLGPAVKIANDAESNFRMACLAKNAGLKQLHQSYLREAAARRYVVFRESLPIESAKYLFSIELLRDGQVEDGRTWLESALRDGDLQAEDLLIKAYSMGIESSLSQIPKDAGAAWKQDARRAAQLTQARAYRVLGDTNHDARQRCAALADLAKVALGWGGGQRPDPKEALSLAEKGYAEGGCVQSAEWAEKSLRSGAGDYTSDQREKKIADWQMRQISPSGQTVP